MVDNNIWSVFRNLLILLLAPSGNVEFRGSTNEGLQLSKMMRPTKKLLKIAALLCTRHAERSPSPNYNRSPLALDFSDKVMPASRFA